MAQLTIQILGENTKAMQSIEQIESRLDNVGKTHKIKIEIETIGDVKALQAEARLESAKAKRIATENRLKIAQESTKQSEQAANREKEKTIQIEKQATLEIRRRETEEAKRKTAIKQGETAEKQATLATERATEAEKKRSLAIQQGKTAQEQRRHQEEKTKTATEQHATAETKAAAAAEKRAASEAKAAAQTKNLGAATEQTARKAETLWDNFQKFARWYIIGNAFSGIVRSMREALDTMKAVDDELVTIRKVTGFSNEQISGIEQQAYSTASQYGVGASDYLSNVAEFSRAGYKEQSAALAELSTKTQIVGDTTAETANQFLISVDAAYKYKGSVEALTRVLDGANEIDNKYATSIEKIAEGMGTVAPVAAQMNVGIDELAAAIGTITAVTQRSGSEAARALRALFLNIAGDTKTEIDEGVTWTTGEIAGLRDVIKLYAKDAYDAAQATGSIIDPMKAMEGLAKSMQEGLLTEQKLIEMVSDIGGKLRTSQLLAIIQNWDMYQSMLKDYAGAIGSADKEVENALDSWTRKTNQLSATWTEFISHLAETDTIKGGLDTLTGAVEFLDSGVGHFAATTSAAVGTVALLRKGITALKATKIVRWFADYQAAAQAAAAGSTAAGSAMFFLRQEALATLGPLALVAGAVAAVYALYQYFDKITKEYETQKQALDEIESKYKSNTTELESLKSRVGELTDAEKERLAVLQLENYELDKQLQKQREQTFEAWRKTQTRLVADDTGGTGNAFNFGTHVESITANELNKAKTALMALDAEWENGQHSQKGYNDGLKAIAASLKNSAEAIKIGVQAEKELEPEEAALLTLYESLVKQIAEHTVETGNNTDAKSDNTDATNANAKANETLKKALEEVDKKGSLTYGTLEELDALYPGLSKRILDANGNLTAEGKAALSTQSAFVTLIGQMIAFNNQGLDISGKVAQLQELARQAGIAGSAIMLAVGAADMKEAADAYVEIGYSRDEAETAAFNDYYQYNWLKGINDHFKNQEYINPPGGIGGGGSTAKTAEELQAEAQKKELDRLKQIVSDEKARYNLMEAQGASAEKLAAQAKVIQDNLHDQAEYMREIGSNYSDVAALSKEWFDWQNKAAEAKEKEEEAAAQAAEDAQKAAEEARKETLQEKKDAVSLAKQELAFLKASGASDDEIIAKQREIQRALHDQAEYMREIHADEKDIKALSTEWWDIQNDILETTEKIAQKLRDEIADVLGEITNSLEEAADAATKPLQDELDALVAAHDATQDRREEEEKILAVEKARIALENAERDRSVRQYNAAAGQWEWVANPKNLESARKTLADAEAALSKYREAQLYKVRKEALEGDIRDTKSAFDAFKKAMEEAAKAVRDGKMTFEEAYAYIQSEMHRIYDEYGIDISELLTESENTLLNGFNLIPEFIRSALQTSDPGKAIQELTDAIRNGTISNLNDIGQILSALNGEYEGISQQTAKIWALTKMQANSVAWHMTDDKATKAALHDENMRLGTQMGLTYNAASGTWHDASGGQVYDLSNSGGQWVSTLNTALQSVVDFINSAVSTAASNVKPSSASSSPASSGASGSTSGGTGSAASESPFYMKGSYYYSRATGKKYDPASGWEMQADGTLKNSYTGATAKYDRGGILHGVGGIKATEEDEMVLPPDMTRKLLTAETNGAFSALLRDMGIVTAAANEISVLSGGISRTSIGSQHNGDVYEIGGVTLTERQARGMTVYELAQMARRLAIV